MKDSELEVKLFVRNLAAVEERLKVMGAGLVQSRTHELNLRFDTPTGELARNFHVLRLRQDNAARLTFKGPASLQEGVRVRHEIEFEVGDFRSAKKFLLALGYQVCMIYEKFRTVYQVKDVLVTLDEMPYGTFVEVEGPSAASIKDVNQQLGLNWEERIPESYVVLFDRLKTRLDLEFRDLLFENFSDLNIKPDDLSVHPADVAP